MLKVTAKYWIIAIVCGLSAALLFYLFLHQIKKQYSPSDLVQVVKARQNISKDTVVSEENISTESIPVSFIHPDALRNKKEVVGKIASTDIVAGEEILKEKLVSASDEQKRLAYSIPANKRAVSIAVDDISGVSGFIKAGDHVDIVATIDIPVESNQSVPFSVLSLQNIEVLAVGQGSDPSADKKNAAAGKTPLTLAIAVEDAPRLVMAAERGSLRLLLRSPVDKSRAFLPPFQIGDELK